MTEFPDTGIVELSEAASGSIGRMGEVPTILGVICKTIGIGVGAVAPSLAAAVCAILDNVDFAATAPRCDAPIVHQSSRRGCQLTVSATAYISKYLQACLVRSESEPLMHQERSRRKMASE